MLVGSILFVVFLGLVFLGLPITMAMGIATLSSLLFGGYAGEVLALMVYRGTSNFTLIAIPYFVLAGCIMNSTGITTKIFDFATACTGWMRGGLAQVNVVASMIFSGISGTATADAAGLGLIEMQAMTEKGYEKPFSAAITLASSMIGPIIPPSVGFIVYAMLAQVSVAKLFIAGIIPGIIMGVTLIIMNWYLSKSGRVVMPEPEPFDIKEAWRTFKEGILALLAPVVLLGGILSGVVTATEAGILAVVYSIIVGIIYKAITFEGFLGALKQTIDSSALIMFLIGMGTAIGWVATAERLPVLASSALFAITTNKYLLLIIINIFLLILGCFLDGNTIKLIMVPILLPVMDRLGVDRLTFGVWQTMNALIGMATPPVGVGLFIMSSISDLTMEELIKAFVPFFIPLVITLILIVFIPQLTLWLPSLLMP